MQVSKQLIRIKTECFINDKAKNRKRVFLLKRILHLIISEKRSEDMKEKIIETLSATEGYISGEELSEIFGVSRTAIWKHINALKEEGYEIESQTRKGYKLLKRPDALLKAEILFQLKTQRWGKEYLYTYDEVDSTNVIAKKLANEGKPEGTAVVAEFQRAGKGRLGRKWVSPKGSGIWLSLILRPPMLPTNAPQLSFVIAVGMVRALKNTTGLDIKTKWPNDILIDRKKVAGILTEISAEMERINYIVVGIGVNVNQRVEDFPIEFRDKSISLRLANQGQSLSRVKILQGILEEMERVYNNYLEEGFEPILEEWKNNSITIGEEVQVIMGEERFNGVAIDIDKDGSLLVKKDNGEVERIIAGDVSLRKKGGQYA